MSIAKRYDKKICLCVNEKQHTEELMALPSSINDLLEPTQLPRNWEFVFASRALFRLPGFGDRLKKIRVPHNGTGKTSSFGHKNVRNLLRSDKCRVAAVGNVPEKWSDAYDHLEWEDPPGEKLVRKMLNGGALMPLKLDRAGMMLALVEAALKEYNISEQYAIGDFVRIAPAIYKLPQFNDAFFKAKLTGSKEKSEKFAELQGLMNNYEPSFFHDVAAGCPATHKTLATLSKACSQIFPDFSGTVEPFTAPPEMPVARNEVLEF